MGEAVMHTEMHYSLPVIFLKTDLTATNINHSLISLSANTQSRLLSRIYLLVPTNARRKMLSVFVKGKKP